MHARIFAIDIERYFYFQVINSACIAKAYNHQKWVGEAD